MKEQHVLSGPVIQMDETTVQVMNEPEKSNTSTSYMWLARGGPPGKPVVDYAYHRSRGSEYAKAYLSDFSGYLQTDGYVGYETALKDRSDIIHVGCMAHVRRKFFEAGKSSKKAGSAHQAVSKIAEFYRIEKELRSQDLSDDEFTQQAQSPHCTSRGPVQSLAGQEGAERSSIKRCRAGGDLRPVAVG
jgi:transposase